MNIPLYDNASDHLKARFLEERSNRIDAEVAAVMKEHGGNMEPGFAARFEDILRGVKQGEIACRRVKAGAAPDASDDERFEIITASLSAEASEILVKSLEQVAQNLPRRQPNWRNA